MAMTISGSTADAYPLAASRSPAKGKITATDLRLNLHKAELTGTITTDQGKFNIHALTHSTQDAVYFKTNASNGESISIQWLPEVAHLILPRHPRCWRRPPELENTQGSPLPRAPEAHFG